jgi:transposase
VNSGKFVLAQLLETIHPQQFQRCVARFGGDYKVSQFSCWSQFVCMAFAQLTWRESLRDIEACLNSRSPHLYHLGLSGPVRRSTLADANHSRDWRIFAALAEGLLRKARRLYAGDSLQIQLDQALYAIDASIIDLGLHLCPWARFDFARSSLKLHLQLDLRGPLPAAVEITPSRFQEVLWLDSLHFEPGAFYLLDRGYTDYARLHAIERTRAWFVIRARRRMTYARLHSSPVAPGTSVRSDQIIQLTAFYGRKDYPDKLRRIRCYDAQNTRSLVFLTNHFGLPAAVIAELYRQRWQVELFFKWLKQHLRIKAFYGRSENAVRTQIWVALCVYALVAIARKQAQSEASLFQILQVLSVSAFDKTPINELVSCAAPHISELSPHNQLMLFE